jgi:hypothetical protein
MRITTYSAIGQLVDAAAEEGSFPQLSGHIPGNGLIKEWLVLRFIPVRIRSGRRLQFGDCEASRKTCVHQELRC